MLYTEYGAIVDSVFTETQWFNLPRDERRNRVAYRLGKSLLEAMSTHDAHEEAKRKAKSKAKK